MQSVWKGLELTIYGMGLVFLILAVLAGLIGLLIRLDRAPDQAAEPATTDPTSGTGAGADAASTTRATPAFALTPELMAAVVVACRAHRMSRRKQAAPEMRTHEPGSLPSRWVGSGRTRQNRSWAPGGRYS